LKSKIVEYFFELYMPSRNMTRRIKKDVDEVKNKKIASGKIIDSGCNL